MILSHHNTVDLDSRFSFWPKPLVCDIIMSVIERFGPETGLLLIDVQRGVDVLDHWGGPTGRRNNPGAEANMCALLEAWRQRGWPVLQW